MSASVPTLSLGQPSPAVSRMTGTGLAYSGIVIFTFAYFVRPEEIVPAVRFLSLAMIGGALSIAGFLLSLLQSGKMARGSESRILLAILAWFALLVPTSNWPGGSFQVFNDYIWKGVAVAIVISNAVDTFPRLRRLLAIQVFAIALVAFRSRGKIDERSGRLFGESGNFGNANDLAIIIAITIPFALYLIMTTKNTILKTFWVLCLIVMTYISVLTLSRSGFLCLLAAVVTLGYHFGVKGKRVPTLIVATGLIVATMLVAAPDTYFDRIASIVDSDLDAVGTRKDAAGTRESRWQLFVRSVEVTKEHPVFGVGPGQFEVVSGHWQVSHNMYLQFATETGIPGLILFIMLLWAAWRNLRDAERAFPQLFSPLGCWWVPCVRVW